jgi:hypothetical protein
MWVPHDFVEEVDPTTRLYYMCLLSALSMPLLRGFTTCLYYVSLLHVFTTWLYYLCLLLGFTTCVY